MKTGVQPVRLKVFNPLSTVEVSAKNAARLDTLQGKTIGELWVTGHFRGDETFPVIRELLQKQFPKANFVPYTEFPVGSTMSYPVPPDRVGELLKEKGCDAVLLGNGG